MTMVQGTTSEAVFRLIRKQALVNTIQETLLEMRENTQDPDLCSKIVFALRAVVELESMVVRLEENTLVGGR